MSCDSINYQFNDIDIKNGNCWSIGALLAEWFVYNNDNNISTDVFLEVPFTKEQSRTRIKILTDIISQRRSSDTVLDVTDVNNPVSILWILTLELYFHDCLIKDKTRCKYAPNVRLHYADVRLTAEDDINIFIITDILNVIKDSPNESEIIALLDVINFLIENVEYIYNLIYMDINPLPNSLDYFNHVLVLNDDTLVSKLFRDKLSRTLNMSVIRNNIIHRTSAELDRLAKINPGLADNIKSFIIKEIKKVQEDLYYEFDDIVKSIPVTNNSMFEKYIPSLIDGLKDLSAFDMDIYSKCFEQYRRNNCICW